MDYSLFMDNAHISVILNAVKASPGALGQGSRLFAALRVAIKKEHFMTLFISPAAWSQLQQHGEAAYPEEGAGLILGLDTGGKKLVTKLIMLDNTREAGARHNRYLLKPRITCMPKRKLPIRCGCTGRIPFPPRPPGPALRI